MANHYTHLVHFFTANRIRRPVRLGAAAAAPSTPRVTHDITASTIDSQCREARIGDKRYTSETSARTLPDHVAGLFEGEKQARTYRVY